MTSMYVVDADADDVSNLLFIVDCRFVINYQYYYVIVRSVTKCGQPKVIALLSILRLELNGAIFLANIIHKIKISFVCRVYLINVYSDSDLTSYQRKIFGNQANLASPADSYFTCAKRPLWWHGPVWLGQRPGQRLSHRQFQTKFGQRSLVNMFIVFEKNPWHIIKGNTLFFLYFFRIFKNIPKS